MAKLVSMKLDKKARKEAGSSTALGDAPDYPWGLTITLDNDTIEKLGLADDLPEAGESMVVQAKADVVTVSSRGTGTAIERSVTLQITDLSVVDPDDATAVGKLYGGEKT